MEKDTLLKKWVIAVWGNQAEWARSLNAQHYEIVLLCINPAFPYTYPQIPIFRL